MVSNISTLSISHKILIYICVLINTKEKGKKKLKKRGNKNKWKGNYFNTQNEKLSKQAINQPKIKENYGINQS